MDADTTSNRRWHLSAPSRDAWKLLLALGLGSGVGVTFGGFQFGSAKAEPPLAPLVDLADVKAELAGVHADVRALMQSQQELREDVRELRRLNARGR